MNLKQLQKNLKETIKLYESSYKLSLDKAYEAISKLPESERAEYVDIMNKIKKASKTQDEDSLKELLKNMKNKS